MHILRNAFRALGFLLLALLLLLIVALLAVRFYIAPNIDQWRPELQAWVNKEIHPGLSFDKFKIQWQGIEPEVVLEGAKFLNQAGQSEGSVQLMHVQMDWLSLLKGQAKVHELSLDQAHLSFHRDAQGYVRFADEAVLYSPHENTPKPILPLNKDLQEQERKITGRLQQLFAYLPDSIHLRNSQVNWRDEQRDSPDLHIKDIQLDVVQGLNGLQIQGSMAPPENLANVLRFTADINSLGQGKAIIKLDEFYPQTLRHWVALPVLISEGYMEEAELVLSYERGEISHFDWQSQWRNFVLHEEQGAQTLNVQLDALDLRITSDHGVSLPYKIEFAASNLAIQAEEFFRHPVIFYGVQGDGIYLETNEGLPRIEFNQLKARLPTGALSAHGAWQVDPYSDNGILDVEASIDFLALADLPRYLPKAIAAESLDWLEKAFQAGQIEKAQVKINGIVDHIPFGRRPNSGEFHIQGTVKNVQLNYHQFPDRASLSWPILIADQAQIDFKADHIQVTAEQAQMQGLEAVKLGGVQANISHIEKNTEVSVKAQVVSTGEGFKDFYRSSPLKLILRGALDPSQISGKLEGNLALNIPISDVDATTVDGLIEVSQASFQFEPIYPPISQAHGKLKVSEKNLQVLSLQGQMLGGPASAKGIIGGAGDSLQLSGEMTGAGLREFLPLKGLERLQGRTAYNAKLDFLGQERINFSLNSSLKGLALNLPGELKKSAEQVRELSVQWLDKRPKAAQQLVVDYANKQVRVLLERVNKSASFFHRGVIAVNRAVELPSNGLAVQIKGGDWDLVQWEDLVDEFDQSIAASSKRNSRSTQANSGARKTPLFPPLKSLDLQMDHMDYHILHVDNIQLLGNRIDNRNWALELRSADIQGKVSVQLSQNLQQIEALSGAYDHLHLREDNVGSSRQTAGAQKAAGTSSSGRLDLPNLDLKIKRLSAYGQNIGALTLKGSNKSKDRWQLEDLSVHNDVGSLFATGSLIAQGNRTSAQVALNMNALNMGKFLEHFGLKQLMIGGNGFINGRVNVPDVLQFSLDSLRAEWEAQVTQGSLLSIHSKAVKALEFISLQSLSRLSQVGEGHRLFGEGLQFDYVRGSFAFEKQRLRVSDFRLDGPLVAVVAMGHTNLPTKALDFHAVAVPKIEMSGAAILSGIIVNPVVGVGAFLTQWLLQEPLGRALTQYFHVTGTWDKPKLDDVALPSEEQLKEKNTQRKIDDLYRN